MIPKFFVTADQTLLPPPTPIHGRRPCLLIAADQPPVLRTLGQWLGGLDYPVATGFEEGDAIARILAREAAHHLLITSEAKDHPLVSAAHVVERLRDLGYPGRVQVRTATSARAVEADTALLEHLEALTLAVPEGVPCLSILPPGARW